MKSSYRRASTLGEAELRELWRFRLTHVELKPTVSPEEDFAAFAADFDRPGWAWILRDGGRVVGFFLQRAEAIDFEGRRILAMLPEYGFLAAHLRGRPVLPTACLVASALAIGRHQGLPKYVAGSVYPPSYIAFRRAMPRFWSVNDPRAPAAERRLMLELGRRASGAKFDPVRGVVEMRTRPLARAESASAESRRIYDDYVAANPEWSAGWGLFVMFPLDARQVARVMLHAVERQRRRLVGASPGR